MPNDDPVEDNSLLTLSDLITPLAAMLEQKLYSNRLDVMMASRYALLGIVSRMVETLIAQNGDTFYLRNRYRNTKNELIVFGLNYLVSMAVDRKVSRLGVAGRAVNADLLAKWVADSTFGDRVLVPFPGGSTPSQ